MRKENGWTVGHTKSFISLLTWSPLTYENAIKSSSSSTYHFWGNIWTCLKHTFWRFLLRLMWAEKESWWGQKVEERRERQIFSTHRSTERQYLFGSVAAEQNQITFWQLERNYHLTPANMMRSSLTLEIMSECWALRRTLARQGSFRTINNANSVVLQMVRNSFWLHNKAPFALFPPANSNSLHPSIQENLVYITFHIFE